MKALRASRRVKPANSVPQNGESASQALPDEPAATQTPAAPSVDEASATPPDAPEPAGQIVSDPQTTAAIQQIQSILQGQGAADPIYLLGRAQVRISILEEALNIAVQEIARLAAKK